MVCKSWQCSLCPPRSMSEVWTHRRRGGSYCTRVACSGNIVQGHIVMAFSISIPWHCSGVEIENESMIGVYRRIRSAGQYRADLLRRPFWRKFSPQKLHKDDFNYTEGSYLPIGRWVAELVARLLSMAALWVRIKTSLKNTKWAT
jgi:hypothetical protein